MAGTPQKDHAKAAPVSRTLGAAQAMTFPALLTAVFGLLVLTDRVSSAPALREIFLWVTVALALLCMATFALLVRRGDRPQVLTVIAPPHYVQMTMHLCIFLYWGWYWPQVYAQTILILAQLVFVHVFDMCLRWLQRKPWIFGFGRFPIIFSTNLFLWFRDDWFYWQFVMIAFGVLAKEYFTWTREGRRTHIFNPSAISLSIASVILIVTGTTDISWAAQISNTLNLPPHIYLEIFVLGLIVQFLFQVTLVTLSTVIWLLVCGFLYYKFTGVYFFYTSDIPIAVFLGLHLLVTDPVTTPRSYLGKLLFGFMYGASVMILFEVLERFGAPTFYDKLLAVPLLNLCVLYLDRVAGLLPWRSPPFGLERRHVNLLFIGSWLLIFAIWTGMGHVGDTHPGRQSQFWEQACADDRRKACVTLFDLLDIECDKGNAPACGRLGSLSWSGTGTERDEARAYQYVQRACRLGLAEACEHQEEYRPRR